MIRTTLFTFRVNKVERQQIERIANRLQRTRADTLRMLVRAGLSVLDQQPGKEGAYAKAAEPTKL